MAAHTPGPWSEEGGTIYGSPGRHNNPLQRPVADVVAQGKDTRANAALIIAAPDLLKACRAALEKVSGTNIMGEEVEPRLCAQLRTAIAKAEGR